MTVPPRPHRRPRAKQSPTVDDVFGSILGRIESGELPLGSKLPSCRALADELASNPTTVNRALARLAEAGLVRIETRKGTFVAASETVEPVGMIAVRQLLEQAADRARSAGIGRGHFLEIVDEVLTAARPRARVAFVECNRTDLDEMAELLRNATGIDFEQVDLHDLSKKTALRFDAIATPIFHLSDVHAAIGDLDRVIELNFVPSAATLRAIASVDPELTLAVATPIPRGIERLRSLVRQYFAGEVRGVLTGEGPVDLTGIDVVVVTSATSLSARELEGVPRTIRIEWELEHSSGVTFDRRLQRLLDSPLGTGS